MNLPSEGFSSDSYPGFKLHHIGNWQTQWWGMQWFLTHQEVEEVIKEIEAEQNYMKVNCEGINTFFDGMIESVNQAPPIDQNSHVNSAVSKLFTGFLGLMSNAFQTNESSYEYLKQKIQDSDVGNGLVIDLGGKYSNQLGTAIVILNSGKISPR